MANLPARIERLGGAIVQVLAWEQHQNLPVATKYAVGRIITTHPELNTEERVDMLADLAGYYGEEVDANFSRLLEQYSMENIYLAIDVLRALSRERKTRPESDLEHPDAATHRLVDAEAAYQGYATEEELERVLDLLELTGQAEYEVENTAQLAFVIGKLGGFSTAWPNTVADLLEVLNHEEDSEVVDVGPAYEMNLGANNDE